MRVTPIKARAICGAALVFCLGLGPALPVLAQSDGPAPFPEFSAKRVKPPSKSTRKRITVQIAPQATAPAATTPAAAVAPAAPAGRARGGGGYAWFWDSVSPALSDSGPGRLEPALVRLQNPPSGKGVAVPRLQDLQNIAAAHGVEILKSTVGTQVSPALALAVIAVESGGRQDVTSSAGAQGLMQLMPATAERFGVTDAFQPAQNIRGGVRFLDFLMQKFAGDPIMVLAGYNAGENAVTTHDGVPPYAETRDYVPKVLAAFRSAQGLCVTPPELISDGCVFRVMQ